MTSLSAKALGDTGPFSEGIEGFKSRPGQIEMAEAVENAISSCGTLVSEAGTGVGKTFAYLVPALLSGEKVIVSTGTRHLQDQLFLKDLPVVSGMFKQKPKAALLKGRSNYLCKHRLSKAQYSPHLSSPESQNQLGKVARWAEHTVSGDISELSAVTEDDPIWAHVTSNIDVCADHEADEFDGCFVLQARKKAQEADLVVVNHHLFCADLALKEEGFGEILPSAAAFIFDEAHQLPEVASSFFGKRLASRQIIELARDIIAAQLTEAPDEAGLRLLAEDLERAVRDFRLAMGIERRRAAWIDISDSQEIAEAFPNIQACYAELERALDKSSERGRALETCHKRVLRQMALLENFDDDKDDEFITWFETYSTGFSLNLTPLDVAGPFARAMAGLPAAWIFTSATLTVNGEFNHFRRALGISKDAEQCVADSPFDYMKNAMLFAPPNMPQPNSPQYSSAVLDLALPIIKASRGRCFMLFTSHRALNEAADYFEDRLDYPIYVQGKGSKTELLQNFRDAGNGVLLGTSSFWEGVDVRGEALSCVIIDKLPFGSPGDPVTKARIQALERSGRNPFMDYQIPQAITQLKQGVGRLIRDETDRGVLVLCDPRLTEKAYGSLFLNSLPRMHRTRLIDKVETFFERQREQGEGA